MRKSQVITSASSRRAQFVLLAMVIALSLVTTGCGGHPSGNTPLQGERDTSCNASFFDVVRFSHSQQDGTVLYASYVTDTSFTQPTVVALNPLTGQHIWQRSFAVNANAAMRLTAADGIVYALFQRVNTDWSWIFALDAHTGQQLWAYDEEGYDDIAVCNGVTLILGNGSLHAFESKTGHLLWNYGQEPGRERLGSTLSATKDTLYFLSISLSPDSQQDQQATVHALDLRAGKEHWKVKLPHNQGQFETNEVSLTLTEQALYVLQSSLQAPGQLVALRPHDGVQIWSATSQADQKILMASHDTLYLANPWDMDAFQSSNGKHLWSKHFEGTANRFFGSSEHGIFEIQYASVFCSLDLTNGTTKWSLQLSLLEWDGTPFFVDTTTIYLFSDGDHNHPDDNHDLYVVDKQTGKVRKHFKIHSLTGAITTL